VEAVAVVSKLEVMQRRRQHTQLEEKRLGGEPGM